VIYFHPGAFMFGDKTDIPDSTGKALLKDGYALVGVNYRLSGEAKFPAAVQDAKASARFLRANAAEYDLDPDNFVAWGASAGGNLAALVGVSDGAAYFDDPSLGNPGVSGGVEAVIDWFGPTNFGLLDEQAKAQGSPASDQTTTTRTRLSRSTSALRYRRFPTLWRSPTLSPTSARATHPSWSRRAPRTARSPSRTRR